MVRLFSLGGVERVGGCTGKFSGAKSNRTLIIVPLSTNGKAAFLLGGVERVGGCTGEFSEAKSNRTLIIVTLSTNG